MVKNFHVVDKYDYLDFTGIVLDSKSLHDLDSDFIKVGSGGNFAWIGFPT